MEISIYQNKTISQITESQLEAENNINIAVRARIDMHEKEIEFHLKQIKKLIKTRECKWTLMDSKLNEVSKRSRINSKDILSTSRKSEIVKAKRMFARRAKKVWYTYEAIATYMWVNHASIFNLVNNENTMKRSKQRTNYEEY